MKYRLIKKISLLLASFLFIAVFTFFQEKSFFLNEPPKLKKNYLSGEVLDIHLSIRRSWSSLSSDIFIEQLPDDILLIQAPVTKTNGMRLDGANQLLSFKLLPLYPGDFKETLKLRLGRQAQSPLIEIELPHFYVSPPENSSQDPQLAEYHPPEKIITPKATTEDKWYKAIIVASIFTIAAVVVILLCNKKSPKPDIRRSLHDFLNSNTHLDKANLGEFSNLLSQLLQEEYRLDVKTATTAEIALLKGNNPDAAPLLNILAEGEIRFLPGPLPPSTTCRWHANCLTFLKENKA